ncbi:atp-dependent rna helicase dbp10 [Acrodontium crateriforme]|uniref:RNA helicase n=1 Tax=Acrodontium crateriforme TaxID=150365 RepID=A0AAQ3RE35_9PEZI|nr:atp-dependent rna helicase dbp10 [Acrodontium crateriforme]
MARQASPALSENEFDISKSLFQGGSDDEDFAADFGLKTDAGKAVEVLEDSDDADGDEDFIAATQAAANRRNDNKSVKKAGAFQSMGLNTNLLKAITRKGFTVPTPIQRKTVPLILDGQDVVGMARTGSGKTAAFVIPMIEKLKSHSAKVGARAIILSPSRELALQTLKVVKELGKGTDLRTTLLVGGDSLEEQFGSMASNPDIIIATPGRFEHLKVEMGLQLHSVKYIVFDEADRLFEMGFAAQLTEIMHSLPPTRQTLLFSATLPKSLVEFARAGLQDPTLVRLDAESKIAPGLESAFFTLKRADKEGALLHILQDVIQMPTGPTEAAKRLKSRESENNKKRKRNEDGFGGRDMPSPHSTVIFAATKHHVEYLATFLKAFDYATSYVYGALDQTARKMQVHDFRTGMTNILVVTDVAARGLDIPILANVINYDFPSQPKIFVHRVGRTARADKKGWAYSLVTGQDMPYLLDLQLFLGRKLILGKSSDEEAGIYKNAIVVGNFVREKLERCNEEAGKLLEENGDLSVLRDVAGKGERQYLRTRNAASVESVKRAKAISQQDTSRSTHMLFGDDVDGDVEQKRLDMLAIVSGFRPLETVFEISHKVGKKGAAGAEMADVIKKQRGRIEARQQRKQIAKETEALAEQSQIKETAGGDDKMDDDDSDDELVLTQPNMEDASEDELEMTFTAPARPVKGGKGKRGNESWQDSEHFMSYTPATINLAEDRGYGVQSGGTNSSSHFVNAARDAAMDLTNDESSAFKESKPGMRWDKRHKKYVSRANDEDGSKGQKMIRGESGLKIPASFRSGRFDAWRKANKVERLPQVGEMERANSHFAKNSAGGQRFKHNSIRAPKDADKYRDDYDVRKKRVAEAREKRVGRFADGAGKNELRGTEDVRKLRKLKDKRREKNARPSKKKF